VKRVELGPLSQAVGEVEAFPDMTKIVGLDEICDCLSVVGVFDGIDDVVVIFVVKGIILIIDAVVFVAFNLIDLKDVDDVDFFLAVVVGRLDVELNLKW